MFALFTVEECSTEVEIMKICTLYCHNLVADKDLAVTDYFSDHHGVIV